MCASSMVIGLTSQPLPVAHARTCVLRSRFVAMTDGMVNLVGGGGASCSITGPVTPHGIGTWLETPESDAALLNTPSYARNEDGTYRCDVAPINLLGFIVSPELTVHLHPVKPRPLQTASSHLSPVGRCGSSVPSRAHGS